MDGATNHHVDQRVPDPPVDLLAVLDDPAQRTVAEAFWRLGYAAGLDKPHTRRDRTPPGVRVLNDFELHTTREG